MKKILFAASALTLMASAPAFAQPIIGDMMGMGGPGGPRSCVMNGQFAPCPPPGGMMGGPGMGMGGPGMRGGDMGAAPQRRMSRAEMRRMRAQGGGQGGMMEDEGM